MKAIVLSLSLLVSAQASAQAIVRYSVEQLNNNSYQQIAVQENGDILKYDEKSTQLVGKLDKHQVKALRKLAKHSAKGERAENTNQITCRALPSKSIRITSGPRQTLLKYGKVPCGHMTWNTAPEAAELVKYIEALAKSYGI